ncbi:transmembrane protein [Legionella spiritensis]|uniref:Transmembrane protein n=1 Tax=Legionella spiritensis TaxID=452 RepID=A0A0W0ZAU9_LEGSP|nr:transmembrane protein [Legionella spiritensis]SNV44246.1 transmembrane protein [Legionella spiritensis]
MFPVELLRIYAALASTLLLWASAFVGIRIGLVDYSPGALALLRFLVASLFMAIIYVRLPAKKAMSWKTRMALLTIGIGGIGIYNLCLNYGEMTVSAGVASFVIGLIPVITIILSVLLLRERPGPGVWLGIVLGFCGLFLIMAAENAYRSQGSGVLMIMVSALMGGIYTFSQKRYLQAYHPVIVTAWIIWGGTFMLLIFLPDLIREIPHAGKQGTIAAVYMGIFPAALAYVAWSYVIHHWSATNAATFLYAMPVISTVMGYLVLYERPGRLSLIGGFIALAGALVASRFQQRVTRSNAGESENSSELAVSTG